MKLAAVRALAELARAEPSDIVALAYGEADAAVRARLPHSARVRPAPHHHAWRPPWRRRRWTAASRRGRSRISTRIATSSTRFVYESGATMEPVFAAAKRAPKRVAYAEGEDERVLRAAQAAVDEGLARPVLVGRTDVIASRIAEARAAADARRATATASTSWTTRAIAITGPSTTSSRGARA